MPGQRMPKQCDVKLRCFSCGKPTEPLEPDFTDHPADAAMWDAASVGKFAGGYGSRHDMALFLFSVCDDCLSTAEADGRLVQIGDLFSPYPGDPQ